MRDDAATPSEGVDWIERRVSGHSGHAHHRFHGGWSCVKDTLRSASGFAQERSNRRSIFHVTARVDLLLFIALRKWWMDAQTKA